MQLALHNINIPPLHADNPMKFVCYSAWDQLPDSADALFAQAEQHSLFFSRPWFECLTGVALALDQTLVLACVVSDNNILAILPLLKSTDDIWRSLKHRYSTHYSLLLADADQPQVLACLAQGLNQLPLRSLLLEPVADDDSRMTGLQQSLAAAGFHCERFFRAYNWIYRGQEESYAAYLANRPARLRNTIARKRRKLEREHGYAIRLFTGTDVPSAMHDYHAVYRASWKANEQYTGLVDGIVAAFSTMGWSRLAVLYVKGQPVAAQLWFVLHGKASIFRLAYDEAWRQYSPGSILTAYLMEYVIDIDKVVEIDFLTGNDAYKQDWMSARREHYALNCMKPFMPAGRTQQIVNSIRRILTGR